MSCTSSLHCSRVSLWSSRMAAQMKSSKVKSVLMACCSESGLLSEKTKQTTCGFTQKTWSVVFVKSILYFNAFTWTAFLCQSFLIAGPFNLLGNKLQVVTTEDLKETQCVTVFKLPLETQQKPPWMLKKGAEHMKYTYIQATLKFRGKKTAKYQQLYLWQKAKPSMLSVTKCACSWGSSSFNKAASNSGEQQTQLSQLFMELFSENLLIF